MPSTHEAVGLWWCDCDPVKDQKCELQVKPGLHEEEGGKREGERGFIRERKGELTWPDRKPEGGKQPGLAPKLSCQN